MGYRKDNMKKTLSSLLTIFGLCILSVGCSDEDSVMKTIDEESPVSFDGRFCLISESLFKFCSVTFLSPPVSPFPQPNRT